METFLKVLDFLKENWETLLGGITTLVSIIVAIIAAIKNKDWKTLKDTIAEYIKEAELLDAAGIVKKEIVLAKAQTLCAKLHIKYDEKKIGAIIESIILLTKIVNAREKDKEKDKEENKTAV